MSSRTGSSLDVCLGMGRGNLYRDYVIMLVWNVRVCTSPTISHSYGGFACDGIDLCVCVV